MRERLIEVVVDQHVHRERGELPPRLQARRLAQSRKQRIERQHGGKGRQDAPGTSRVEATD
jgi:hypothetical protein